LAISHSQLTINKGGISMRKKVLFNLLISIGIIVSGMTVGGCNIFAIFTPEAETAQDHYEKGLGFFFAKDFVKAEEEFRLAMTANPNDPNARYYHSKSFLYTNKITAIDLLNEVNKPAAERSKMPFFERTGAAGDVDAVVTRLQWVDKNNNSFVDQDEVTVETAPLTGYDYGFKTRLYQSNKVIIANLRPISDGVTDPSDEIGPTDVYLDLTLAYLLSAALLLRDTNQDGKIFGDKGPGVKEEDFYFDMSQGLNNLFNLDMNNLSQLPDSTVNQMLTTISTLAAQGGSQLINFVGTLPGGEGASTAGLDTTKANEAIGQVGNTANLYQIRDGKDNDGDATGITGTAPQWIDTNTDTYIAKDANGDGKIQPDETEITWATWTDLNGDGFVNKGELVYKSGINSKIDEEFIDGVDNDGDGRTDEDAIGKWRKQ
jgi:hypothetical protein